MSGMEEAMTDPCPLCTKPHHVEECPQHNCTGDNCYCIGGDENLDNAAALQDAWDAYCLHRVAPFEGD